MNIHRFDDAKFKPPERLSERVANYLWETIQKGRYQPGDKLPSEANLAEDFGVSRTVIRESLARLKYDGYLDIRQGLGARIVEIDENKTFKIKDLEHASNHRLEQVFELRAIIENEAASLAAKRRTQEHLEQMWARLEDMDESIRRNLDGSSADSSFHHLIAISCQNPYVIEFMEFLNSKIQYAIRIARQHSNQFSGWPNSVQQEHIAIYNAISEGDERAARTAMQQHISQASRRLGLRILE